MTAINERPFEHIGPGGTRFVAERSDFQSGVYVWYPRKFGEKLEESDVRHRLMRDVAAMIGFHASNILPKLNGFAGYDTIHFLLRWD